MKLSELKKSIHEKTERINDKVLLEQSESIIDNTKAVFIIPDHMKEGLRMGEEDIKNGRIHTMEDFEKRYEHYLSPKRKH